MSNYSSLSCLLLSLPLLAQNAVAADTSVELAPVTVQATSPDSLTVAGAEAAKKQLQQVAGGTSLVTSQQIEKGASGNLEDVVAYVPGVYAQGKEGAATRLSIRGSGISLPWVIKGVRLLRNGLPIVEADGWYHSQLIEPLNYQYVEVYRGANALQYGGKRQSNPTLTAGSSVR